MSWNEVEGKGEGKATYTKFEEGKAIQIRILDSEPISKWTHWLQASGRSVTCLNNNCPVCKVIKEQKEAGIEKPTYSSSKKFTLHVLNRSTNCVELLEQGKDFFEQLLTYQRSVGDLRSYDLKIIRSGKGTNTKYSFIPMPITPLTDAEKDMYEANKFDIVALSKPYTEEQVLGLMAGKPASEVFNNKNEDIEIEG
jgi:hypothetical protein